MSSSPSSRSMAQTVFVGFFLILGGCATPPTPREETPPAPAPPPGPVKYVSPENVRDAVEQVTGDRHRQIEKKREATTITIHCRVKLPGDPTDNPELCRSFQLVMVDEAGNESPRFRFATNARYQFSGKPQKKYRVRPILGNNWEFSVDPDRPLVLGDRAYVQLRQKE